MESVSNGKQLKTKEVYKYGLSKDISKIGMRSATSKALKDNKNKKKHQ